MPATKLTATAWMAEQFLEEHAIRWYAEDIYQFNDKRGLYERRGRQWLPAAVHKFLVETLGSEDVTASYVTSVCQSIKNACYLDERLQPPAFVETGELADVIIASNGVVRPSSGERTVSFDFKPHDPSLFAICGVPYDYDESAECPKWMEFLAWMLDANQAEVRLLQQFCAWVFVAKQIKLERILWLCGRGRNGKSTALRVIRYVIGEDATSAVGLEAFSAGRSFRLEPTLNKLANFSNDSAINPSSNVAGLNAFVSQDPFTINRKFHEQLTVEPSTVCFFASNPMPLLNDPSDAFWRRLLLLRCDRTLDDDDVNPHLLTELKQEAPGILNWMLKAIPDLMANRRFDVPESVVANVAKVKTDVNSIRRFVAERLERGDEKATFIERSQLMVSYERWCESNIVAKEDIKVVKDEMESAFGTDLRRLRRGLNGKRIHCWPGVQWKPDEEPEESSLILCPTKWMNQSLHDKDQEIERLKKALAAAAISQGCGLSSTKASSSAGQCEAPRSPVTRFTDDVDDLVEFLSQADDGNIAPLEGGKD